MLRLCGVGKRYRGRAALEGVSLHVRRGDCYGLLGPNGAGKTTALRIALGLIRPDEGSVLVDGFDAARHPREACARQGGLIETPGFYPHLSGPRNLALLGGLSGLCRSDARREAARLVDLVGLSGAGDKAVGAYSQGMRQRLGIALALLGSPDLVLLDEPLNGLDPEGIEEMRRLLRRLTTEDGRTVLLSSHQLTEVEGLCNRIGVIREGRLLVEAETADLTRDPHRRHRLRTGDDAAARAALAAAGLAAEDAPGGGLLVLADERPPAEIARDLVARGVPLLEFAPRPATLEEAYLRIAREGAAAARAPIPAPAAAPPAGPPAVRRAPRRPVLRALAFETRRLASGLGAAVVLALPAVLGAAAVLRLWARETGHLKAVEEGTLFSSSKVTAFEAVATALQAALPLAALLLAGLASQALAGEASRGTLRNLLLRPVGRVPLALGKALGVLAAAALGYVLAAGAAVLLSGAAFDFGDVVEIMEIRSAEPWVVVPAADLWPPFARMLPSLLVPLLAYAALGFLAGAVARRSVPALSLAVGGVVFLDLFRAVGREFGFERALLSAYLPSPLGDTSFAAHLITRIRAPNEPLEGLTSTAVTVPLLWLAAAVLLAALLVRRRPVP